MAPKSGQKANPKWDRFAAEYALDLSPMKAAIRSGYSPTSAAARGAALLKNPRVQVLVQRELDARAFRTGISADTVLFELLRIARCDPGRAYDEHGNPKSLYEMDEDTRRAIQSVDVETRPDGVSVVTKVRFWSKPDALTLIGRHLKLYTDVTEVRLEGLAERIQQGRLRVASRQAGELPAVAQQALIETSKPN